MKSIKHVIAAASLASLFMLGGCANCANAGAAVHPIYASDAAPASLSGDSSQLPAGHPAIPSGDSSQLPPGHPAVPSGGPSNLPPGHPTVNSDQGPATTQPTSEVGTLNIHAVQCTPNGPAIGTDPVNVEFYVRGQLLDRMDTKLNAAGALDVTGLPARFGLQPIVRITHGGVVFTTAGAQIDPEHATQKLDVPIYETTEQMPQWSITMRHVILHPTPTGVDVDEMLSVQSTGDRAWIGKPDARGARITFAMTLPANAKDLKVRGALDGSEVFVADGKLFSKQPLIPGEDRYELGYTIPAVDDKAVLPVIAPANVGHMLVFLPEDGTTLDAPGLKALGSQQVSENGPKTRCYLATSIADGQKMTLTISGFKSITTPPTPAPAAAQPASAVQPPADDAQPASMMDLAKPAAVTDHSMASKAIAVGGAVAILLVGSMITLFKTPKSAKAGKK